MKDSLLMFCPVKFVAAVKLSGQVELITIRIFVWPYLFSLSKFDSEKFLPLLEEQGSHREKGLLAIHIERELPCKRELATFLF